ncbi:MAG: DUF4124 domain-containing protein [Gammaproteobacteria bacterium]|nr:DUF4124 domain-containing protein [Gammaproteobacteria bacterium]
MIHPGVILLLAMLATPAGAEIYKWSDAQGVIHYGDQPPSSTTPTPFNPKTSEAAEARAAEARRQAADQAARKRLEQEKAREAASKQLAASEEEARRKAENCQRARANLEMLQRANMRLTTVDSQGRTRDLDAAARQAEIERANQTISENCP